MKSIEEIAIEVGIYKPYEIEAEGKNYILSFTEKKLNACCEAYHKQKMEELEHVYQTGVGYGSITNWYDKSKQEFDETTEIHRVQKRILYTLPSKG